MRSLEASDHQKIIGLFWQEDDYRDFLKQLFESKYSDQLPSQAQYARILDVSGSFITKVLAKNAHLSAEQIEMTANAIGLTDRETMAFLDKVSLARTTSDSLKRILTLRIRAVFDEKFSASSQQDPRTETPPFNLPLIRLRSMLRGPARSSQELAELMGTSEERIQFLLKQLASFYSIESTHTDNVVKYKFDEHQTFKTFEPHTYSHLAWSQGLRRQASQSLDSRYPIHLVDGGEHHVSGSYLLPVNELQMRKIKVFFAQLTESIVDAAKAMNHQAENGKDKHMIGVCFDVFDLE